MANEGVRTIAVSGATGLIGRAVVRHLESRGHIARPLTRKKASDSLGAIPWDPRAGTIDTARLEGVDAIIHLAGEAIDQRWTTERKREIRESRERGTMLLARALTTLATPPRVFISGSAIGIYGSRGDEVLDETSRRGGGFLADVVEVWERSADAAREHGIRVVHPRMGLALNPHGGVLGRLLPIFKMGGGGKVGDGRQWMSWIALSDVVRIYEFLIVNESVRGPVNVTSPNPAMNTDFSHTLGHVLHRPAIATVPEFAVKLMFGQMGEETVLASQRVMPRALEQAGFQFEHPTLEDALRHELAV
jgi:uncharacterized protein (TIGR01777 family)